jgi:nitrate reductase NapE component
LTATACSSNSKGKIAMKKHLFLAVSLMVLLALGLVGSYFYFLNFTKPVPMSHTSFKGKFSH